MSTPLNRLTLVKHLTENNDFQVSENHFFNEFSSLYEAFRFIQSNESTWVKLRILDRFIIGTSISFIALSFTMIFTSLPMPISLSSFLMGFFGFGLLLFRVCSDHFWCKVFKYTSLNTPFNKKCFEERTKALKDLNQWETQLRIEDLKLLQEHPYLSKWGRHWVKEALEKRIKLDEKKRHEELFLKFIEQPDSLLVEAIASTVPYKQEQERVASSPVTKI